MFPLAGFSPDAARHLLIFELNSPGIECFSGVLSVELCSSDIVIPNSL